VFATSTTYTLTQLANLGTIAGMTQTMTDKVIHGADQACAMAAASNSALAGKYVAWIASPTQSAVQRIGSTARGWVRVDGKPFGDSLTSITAQKVVYYPAAQTEAGTLSTGAVWTGAQNDGTAYPGSNCQNFTSIASTDTGVVGFREAGSELWSTAYSMPCNMNAGVMCFETDFGVIVPAPTPPATKRWMFYTSSSFDPSRGLSGADTLCKNEAATNPTLTGATFSALLSTTTGSLVSRVTARNVPIVRPDGVVLWSSDADLITSGANPISAPSVASDGLTYSGLTSCWTGAISPNQANTLGNGYTCLDWTTNQPGTNNGGISGTTGYSDRAWYNQGTPFCNPSNGHIYCLQN
jgi:hypothetical protein